jgi:hypothetical protein
MKRFFTRMQFFIANEGSCNYDARRIDEIEFPLRYKHLVQRWAPKELPEVDTISSSVGGCITLLLHPYMDWGYFPWME